MVLKGIYTWLGRNTISSIKRKFLSYYSINPDLEERVRTKAIHPRKRKAEIDKIRTTIIEGVFWSNAGAIFALIITLLSLIFSIIWFLSSLFDSSPFLLLRQIISLLSFLFDSSPFLIFERIISPLSPLLPDALLEYVFLLRLIFVFTVTIGIALFTYVLLVAAAPILLKNITNNLPPKQFAEVSLGSLSQSEILTFVSYKMWLLCEKMIATINIPEVYDDLLRLSSDSERFSNLYLQSRTKLIEETVKLRSSIEKYKTEYYFDLNKCTELKNVAVEKLNILPREFCHHILKFSTHLLEVRIARAKANVDLLHYIFNSRSNRDDPSHKSLVVEYISELKSIVDDIADRRMRALEQLVLFNDIHEYIIGLASETSTSQSLKIFSRGLSVLFGEITELFEKDPSEKVKRLISQRFEEILALLHRSKAHFGMDLLISLENYYLSNHKDLIEIPKLLYDLKYNAKRVDSIKPLLKHLRDIRSDIIQKYRSAISELTSGFVENIARIEKKSVKGEKYLLVFGYSKMVLNVLRACAPILRKRKYKILVMKEDNFLMLDTRIFRYELNDKRLGISAIENLTKLVTELNEKKSNDRAIKHVYGSMLKDLERDEYDSQSIRESLTASDPFLYSLIQKDDKVILVGGAEAYLESSLRLLHTNQYQVRIEDFVQRLRDAKDKPSPEVWIIAGDYKVYKEFKYEELTFGREFFSDHYDKVDFYDFSLMPGPDDVHLITNNKIDPVPNKRRDSTTKKNTD